MTDKDGKTSLTAGKGDMLVWASKDGKFGYGKLSFGKTDILKIVLDKTEGRPILCLWKLFHLREGH